MSNKAKFADFHVIVGRLSDAHDEFITVVAEAPVERYGAHFGKFTVSKNPEGFWVARVPGIRFVRDAQQNLILDGSGAPLSPGQIGEKLFQLLFPNDGWRGRQLLVSSCPQVHTDWLRIKLELDSSLSSLPWELMRCPDHEFGAANINAAKLAVVRYFGKVTSQQVASGSDKMPTVLLVYSSPPGSPDATTQDSFNRERDLVSALYPNRFHVEVVQRHPGQSTYAELIRVVQKLEDSSAKVVGVHFIGHGEVDCTGGYFIGEDERGAARNLYAPEIQEALRPLAPQLEWVLLNACRTADSPEGRSLAGLATSLAVQSRIPVVIAHQQRVRTTDAERLAQRFYEDRLVGGRPIEEVLWRVRLELTGRSNLILLQRAVEGRAPETPVDQFGQRRQPQPAGTAAGQAPAAPPNPPQAAPGGPAPNNPAAGLVRIPQGPYWRGFSREQVETLIQQFNRADLPLDMEYTRKELSKEPRVQAQLPEYLIGRTLVTNAEFARFVNRESYVTDAEKHGNTETWRTAYKANKDDHPVVYVSARDAEAYARWAGCRLPTLEEWEKAYRGPEGWVYPWGDQFDVNRCNTAEYSGPENTTPVTSFQNGKSYYGCYDMLGNTEEWTSTVDEGRRMIVGGSWQMSCQLFGLPVLRRRGSPTSMFADTGFRLARDA